MCNNSPPDSDFGGNRGKKSLLFLGCLRVFAIVERNPATTEAYPVTAAFESTELAFDSVAPA